MTFWLNHVTVDTTAGASHTVDPSNPTAVGTVVDGVAFTPTAGRLLVCVVAGPVTSATPSGWTLPTNGSAVSTLGLYVFYKTAAGSDTLATTHNSGSYRVTFDFYEFPSTASFGSSASFPASASGSTKTISGLTGSNLVMAPIAAVGASGAFSFAGATEHFEYAASDAQHRFAIANIYSAASSVGVAATSATHEQLNFAVAGLAAPDATVTVPAAAAATAAGAVPGVSSSFAALPPAADSTSAGVVPVVTATGSASVDAPAASGSAAGLVPALSADATVDVVAAAATAAGVVPSVAATVSATVVATTATGSADAVAPFVFNGSPNATVESPRATATASAKVPAPSMGLGTDVSNVFTGRERGGFATVEVTVPVVEPIGTATTRVDKAVPLPLPVLVKGRPT